MSKDYRVNTLHQNLSYEITISIGLRVHLFDEDGNLGERIYEDQRFKG